MSLLFQSVESGSCYLHSKVPQLADGSSLLFTTSSKSFETSMTRHDCLVLLLVWLLHLAALQTHLPIPKEGTNFLFLYTLLKQSHYTRGFNFYLHEMTHTLTFSIPASSLSCKSVSACRPPPLGYPKSTRDQPRSEAVICFSSGASHLCE